MCQPVKDYFDTDCRVFLFPLKPIALQKIFFSPSDNPLPNAELKQTSTTIETTLLGKWFLGTNSGGFFLLRCLCHPLSAEDDSFVAPT